MSCSALPSLCTLVAWREWFLALASCPGRAELGCVGSREPRHNLWARILLSLSTRGFLPCFVTGTQACDHRSVLRQQRLWAVEKCHSTAQIASFGSCCVLLHPAVPSGTFLMSAGTKLPKTCHHPKVPVTAPSRFSMSSTVSAWCLKNAVLSW